MVIEPHASQLHITEMVPTLFIDWGPSSTLLERTAYTSMAMWSQLFVVYQHTTETTEEGTPATPCPDNPKEYFCSSPPVRLVTVRVPAIVGEPAATSAAPTTPPVAFTEETLEYATNATAQERTNTFRQRPCLTGAQKAEKYHLCVSPCAYYGMLIER